MELLHSHPENRKDFQYCRYNFEQMAKAHRVASDELGIDMLDCTRDQRCHERCKES